MLTTLALATVSAPQVPDLLHDYLSGLRNRHTVIALDFDHDGIEDLAYCGTEAFDQDGRIAVCWGIGGGTFDPEFEIQTGLDVRPGAVPHDFDGDGDTDIVFQDRDSLDLFALVNDGGRDQPAVLPFAQTSATESGFELLDFDGDGDMDLVSRRDPFNSLDQEHWYHERLGPTSFGAPVLMFPAGERNPYPVFPDLDGDGDRDAVTSRRINNHTRFFQWENTGGLPFGNSTMIEIGPQFESALWLFDLDVDGDNDPDVVFSTSVSTSDSVALFRNQGGVLSTRESMVSVPRNFDRAELRDATGTGTRDIVLLDFDGSLILVPDDGGGTYSTSTTAVPGFESGRSAVLSDLDADGVDDLVRVGVVNDGGTFVERLVLNIGTQTPGGPLTFANEGVLGVPFSDPEGLGAADFNGDGYPDVVVAARGGANVGIYENDGAGGFSALREILTGEPNAFELAHGDLDGDGDRDIALTARDQVDWLENPGDDSPWIRRNIYSNANRDAWAVRVVDIDDDGDLDVLHASERILNRQNRIELFENDGSGTFAGLDVIVLPPVGQQIVCFEAGDLDGNGTLDLVFSLNESTVSRLAWAPQLVGGGFGAIVELDAHTVSSSSFSRYRDIEIEDIDDDGDLDVIGCSASFPASVKRFTNDGTGTFSASDIATFMGNEGVVEIELADVDLDGTLDLVGSIRPIQFMTFTEVVVFPGLGGGQFGPMTFTNSGTHFTAHLATADFDLDGDPDFTSIYWAHDRVSVYRNQHGTVVSEPYCGPGVVNSTGRSAGLVVAGSTMLSDNSATLRAFNLPQFSAGFFIVSRTAGLNTMVPNSVGTLCLAGTIGRYAAPMQIQNSGEAGMFALPIDLSAIPQATGFASVMAGEDWRFQAWYRDSSPNGPTSNFTDGVRASWE